MATALSFTVPIRQATPLFTAKRDFAINGGDDIVLQLTVRETDGGAAVDVTGAETMFRITRPGRSVFIHEKTGVVAVAATGRINITLASSDTAQLAGAYHWAAQVELSDRTFTTVYGVMQVNPWPGLGVSGESLEVLSGDHILTGGGDYLLTEGGDFFSVEN